MLVIDEGWGQVVRMRFAKRALRQRIVALVAAYAIALSSLIGSVGSARAAAEAAAKADNILCHSNVAGKSAPLTDETNDRICADCCCVGCLTLIAAAPSPSAKIIPAPQSSHSIALPAITGLAGGPAAKSHQSRAPPRAA
jgi:hypothetical protein